MTVRRIGTLDLAEQGRSGVTTYEGLGGTAVDVEYSADGSLFAALAATQQSESSVSIALWRGGAGDPTGPILLDLGVIGSDPTSTPAGLARSGLAIQCGEVLTGRLAPLRQRIRTDRRL